jgi:hypothetical protein
LRAGAALPVCAIAASSLVTPTEKEAMQLTKTYTYSYELKPTSLGSATIGIQEQATPHKHVTAYASLSKVSYHSNSPPNAAASVGFDDYTQKNLSKNAGGAGVLNDDNITDVKWTFTADKMWARAVIVIQGWD